jgi:hypothetical protein
MFNKRRNVSHFNLFFHNCADFSRDLLNDYYPHAVHRNILVDFALTTPKQDARSLTKFAKRHPELTFSTFVVPQVQGGIPRSKPTHDILESLVKSKKYAAPLVLLSPEVVAGMVTVYLVDGRFKPPAHDPVVTVPTETNPIAPDSTRRVLPKPSATDAIATNE